MSRWLSRGLSRGLSSGPSCGSLRWTRSAGIDSRGRGRGHIGRNAHRGGVVLDVRRCATLVFLGMGDIYDGHVFANKVGCLLVEIGPFRDKCFVVGCVANTVSSVSGTGTGANTVGRNQSVEGISQSTGALTGFVRVKVFEADDGTSIDRVRSILFALDKVCVINEIDVLENRGAVGDRSK